MEFITLAKKNKAKLIRDILPYPLKINKDERDEDVWHYYPKVQEDRFFVAQGATVMVVSSIPAVLLNFPTALYDGKDEVRIPHSKAKVKFSDGRTFSWDLVRKEFFKSSNE